MSRSTISSPIASPSEHNLTALTKPRIQRARSFAARCESVETRVATPASDATGTPIQSASHEVTPPLKGKRIKRDIYLGVLHFQHFGITGVAPSNRMQISANRLAFRTRRAFALAELDRRSFAISA